MNSKQRVLQALDHKEPDRVPVGEWGVDHDIVAKIVGRKSYWRNKRGTTLAFWEGRRDEVVESYKRDLIEFIEKLDHDLVPVHLVPPRGMPPTPIKQIDSTTYEDPRGRVYKYSAGNDSILCIYNPDGRLFSSREEVQEYFERIYVPSLGFRIKGRSGDQYEFELQDDSQLELVRHVVEKFGRDKFIFARDMSNNLTEWEFEFAKNKEEYLLATALQPDLIREFADLAAQVNIVHAKVLIDAGVDAIMPGGDFSDSNGPMISPESIRRIFLPGMKRLSDYCRQRGVRMMSHNCGNNWKIMEILIEAGYECWQSIACKNANMDLKRLKEQYGGRIAFWGGINVETVHHGTPEENIEDVKYALKYAAPNGGFILGTSHSVCYGSSYENYMAALETLRRYGRYPITVD